ncbi:hypothetical protein FUA26_05475 [Seonamhaeicola algicola]|uniref:T9SS C-terminal target domain-containing protein n=1 Tax=Seonamhaeicola algicola TaxID=1719036 RepID=A0A5C7AS67_9FLAO|nr:hypothetical protein [Seonamhaeicola algicola]TXE11520.1 hypothetical protein FUA26_05475 [Seonamhaeicola algicola]
MKIFKLVTYLFFLAATTVVAQQEKGIVGKNNWLDNWTEFKPSQITYREPTQIISGNISEDTKLNKRDTYLLVGSVFVTNNATLTIEPGTVILADYTSKASLTISKGAKIIAEGTETDPIVFSSNRSMKYPGDWGGIVLLGNAPSNKFGNGSVANLYYQLNPANYAHVNFGGDDVCSNSGVLKYVRIEYAGKRIRGAGYLNGLLMAGVGNETSINNVMVSYCAGDAFEIWGGEVSINKAVSYKTSSTDFKLNYGAQCKLNNSLAIRSPYISSSEGSRCLKVLSYDRKEEVDFSKKGTSLIATNLTLLNDSETLKDDIDKGLVNEAVFIGKDASLDMKTTVISGFNPAVILDDDIVIGQESLEQIQFSNMYFNNCNGNIFEENNINNDDLENWYGNAAFFNVYSKSSNVETFIDIQNERRPDYRLRINKIIATNIDDIND